MKALKRFFYTAMALALLAAAAFVFFIYFGATSWRSAHTTEMVIERGATLRGISRRLASERVIATPKLFEIVGRARGLDRTLKAGTYEFPAGLAMMDVMGMIARGEVKQYPFTVIEGWAIRDIAAALEGRPFVVDPAMPAEFLRLAEDPDYAAALGFAHAATLEGYLFPDTYMVSKPLAARELIERMTGTFRAVWNGLHAEAEPETRMDMKNIMTLASIVEKETGDPSERSLVASVFLNRLRINMPLQSDPTIIYGLPNFDGVIRRSDIANPHRYNTYVHPGLPPGPICNPGRASIHAVLHPAHSDYLYFVSRNDGTHKFSKSLSEHVEAVNRYQRNGNRASVSD